MGLWTIAVGLAFIAILVWQVTRRGRQMRDLVERGRPVTGEVVEIMDFGGTSGANSRHLRYRFRAADGREYSHRIAISSTEDQSYEEGQAIELMYLPDNPRVSATADMVRMAREAMARRAARD